MSSYMNAFSPFTKNNEHHEDHLTRGFLLLLKYSPSVFYSFHDYVKQEYYKFKTKDQPDMESLFINELKFEITTQVGCKKASNYLNSKLLSILITDETLKIDTEISNSERKAVYDGIVSLNEDWTFIIENKPFNSKVWEEQLSPGKILSNEIKEQEVVLVESPIILEWREIFKRLNYIKCSDVEKIFINDFNEFVFKNYPTLFPYETFEQCKENKDLLHFRIKELLEEIIMDEKNVPEENKRVKYHHPWAWSVKLNNEYINEIGYAPHDSGVSLHFCYGFTVPLSKKFFNFSKNNINKNLQNLSNNLWKFDFHIRIADSYGREIISFSCKSGYESDFIDYWGKNTAKIGQINIDEKFNNLIEEFKALPFILNFEEHDWGNRKIVRIMPSAMFIYDFKFKDLYSFEKTKTLKKKFIEKSREGLSIVDKEEDFDKIVKDKYYELKTFKNNI